MRVHTLRHDLMGRKYREVLAVLLESQASFSLTWRDELSFDPSAEEISSALKTLELTRVRTDRWPGTQLLGSEALVVAYRAAADALAILNTPGSLYSWRAPRYPEDLAFYGPSGKCSFTSIAHERDAWVSDEALASRLISLVALDVEEYPDPNEP